MQRKWAVVCFGLFLLAGWGVSCGGGAPEEGHPAPDAGTASLKAAAELKPTENSTVSGSVTFEQEAGTVHITATVTGLTPGKHGFHIHEKGDCSAPDGSSAGGHFNPGGRDHGGPDSQAHHEGDLGNLEAGEDGSAEYHANYSFLSLQEGANSIIGKAVIVHEKEDDLVSQPTGAAGGRLACGVIEKK